MADEPLHLSCGSNNNNVHPLSCLQEHTGDDPANYMCPSQRGLGSRPDGIIQDTARPLEHDDADTYPRCCCRSFCADTEALLRGTGELTPAPPLPRQGGGSKCTLPPRGGGTGGGGRSQPLGSRCLKTGSPRIPNKDRPCHDYSRYRSCCKLCIALDIPAKDIPVLRSIYGLWHTKRPCP